MSASHDKQLSDAQVNTMMEHAVTWANQHGLVMGYRDARYPDLPDCAIVHAPLALLPVTFPKQRFMQAKKAQPVFNLLVDAVARDEPWLEQVLAGAAQSDPFTARLLKLLQSSREVRDAQRVAGKDVVLGIHRSDYMLDAPSSKFLQVELNTIASSFGCLSSMTSRLHRYMTSKFADQQPSEGSLPENGAIDDLPAAIAMAHKAYGVPHATIVMVVQPRERNAVDQQWLQLRLWEQHGLSVKRLTLAEIAAQGRILPSGALTVSPQGERDGDAPVAVVYYRAGYTPNDYPSDAEWAAREIIERSDAVKCPTAAYQLAGSKKVQQALALPGMLEKFLPGSPEDSALLRDLFAGLWGLDPGDPATAAIIADAVADPDSYVLKPQREGGGNNFYGAELKAKLQSDQQDLAAYILMQRIRPPPQQSTLLRNGQWAHRETLSELGVYGTFLRRGDTVLLNTEVGHLVRTKASDSNEGGVAAGFAVLDSPMLVD